MIELIVCEFQLFMLLPTLDIDCLFNLAILVGMCYHYCVTLIRIFLVPEVVIAFYVLLFTTWIVCFASACSIRIHFSVSVSFFIFIHRRYWSF